MQQIILKHNLKYILTALSLQQKGLLLDALLNTDEDDEPSQEVVAQRVQNDMAVANLYKYIFLLQKDINAKQKHMRELGAKGGAAKKRDKNLCADTPLLDLWQTQSAKINGDNAKGDDVLLQCAEPDELELNENDTIIATDKKMGVGDVCNDKTAGFTAAETDDKASLKPKRKVAKEKFLNIKNNLFTSCDGKKSCTKSQRILDNSMQHREFIPPSVAEVKAFVDMTGLCVDPEVFVNFYEARDWFVGKTAIKKWKPIVKLWHRRAVENRKKSDDKSGCGNLNSSRDTHDDEAYWSALEEKVLAQDNAVKERSKSFETLMDNKTDDAQDNVLVSVCFSNNSDGADAPFSDEIQGREADVLSLVGKFDSDILSAPHNSVKSAVGDYAGLSPFTRFMRRIEDYDLSPEEKK